MVSATTKISIPITLFGATWRRLAAGILRARCRTFPVASILPFGGSVFFVSAVLAPVLSLFRVDGELLLRPVFRGDVLPLPAAVVHNVRRHASVEQGHER